MAPRLAARSPAFSYTQRARGVEFAAFGNQVAERFAHVAKLHRISELAVKIELRGGAARQIR